jgi:hypothetical protein
MNEITMAFFCKLLIKKWNSPRLFVFLFPNNCNEFMTKLSVNINKLATLRNARGGNVPNLLLAASDIERFGAEGITIHPRPDERHIRYQDARDLKNVVTTEYNIEGKPQRKIYSPSFSGKTYSGHFSSRRCRRYNLECRLGCLLHMQTFLKKPSQLLRQQGSELPFLLILL